MKTQKYREFINKKLANKEYVEKEIKSLKQEIKVHKIEILRKQRALAFIREVSIKTQRQLEFHLNDMVTAGLNTVFDTPYEFIAQFQERRDKTECDLFFKKHNKLIDPLLFSGLGAADVAAFSLRCASWSMVKKYRNTLLLDEPFKHLKGEKENKRVIDLMKLLSKELDLQIICINDERAAREDIIDGADRIFEVKQNNKGVSKIKVIK